MSKRISGSLTEKAEKYYNEVAYSLDMGDGKVVTQEQVINYMIETLSDIEQLVGDPVDFLFTNGVKFDDKGNNYKAKKSVG